MRALDVIRKKRDGGALTRDEIALVVNGYTDGSVPDYQMSAWLMAVVLRGMSKPEIADLTEVMLASGKTLTWPTLPGKKVDKHSTGGVGDKTSFLLAPIVAAAGGAEFGVGGRAVVGMGPGAGSGVGSGPLKLYVPMISGRGLGHTGGTLDKLESIAGFNVTQSPAQMQAILEKCGCAIVGQSAEIVPADKKIYALRDVSATVESPALICASIMSKKLAEGIDALVLDVKTGSGAFMKTEDDAAHLAELMVETGERMGKRTAALITDMSQPLGRTVGNALEILECIEILRGNRHAMSEDLRTLSLELSAWMLYLVERVPDVAAGRALAEEMLTSGTALARFRDMLRLQGGGDISVVDKPSRLPRAANTVAFTAERAGFITQVACEQVGVASLLLGGGRSKKEDVIDHAVGLEIHKKIGDEVRVGETICTVHYNAGERLADALTLLREAYVIGAERVLPPKLVKREIVSAARTSGKSA
jgi:pyrimidine-nucleoside phosphorylase